uniref:Xylulose kinase-1 n=1 Tax=Tanacetum cinerariifolium TaxID=118510 RepID=A0A6L2LWS5_TANCI|nr:hypothetical protein [Tanacetum cinerariifolium]
MVAYLEKTKENAEFHQIVDFLSTCSINYALTISLTIYASYIEQFWNTAISKTINSVKQIHAIIDGKAVVISESSVRSDLLFNDEDVIACLTTAKVFENLTLMGFEQISTKLTFQKGCPPRGGGSVERAITTDVSLVAAQDSDNIAKTQSTAMSIGHISQEIGSGHTVRSEEDMMEQETDLTYFIPPTHHNSPLSGGPTPGSDEGRPNLLELMNICTKLSNGVLALEEEKTTQDNMITILKLRVRRLENKKRTLQPMKRILFKGRVETSTNKSLGKDASKQGKNDDQRDELNLTNGVDTEVIVEEKGSGEKGGSTTDQVSTARPEVTAATSSTPPTTTTIFGDEDLTIAHTLIKTRSKKAKEKGVAFKDVEKPPRLTRSTTILQPLLTIHPKDKGKGVLVEKEPKKLQKVKRTDQGLAQIESDANLAQRIYEEELAELDRAQKERQKLEKATIAALTEEFDEIQAIMDADHESLRKRRNNEEQTTYKNLNDFVPMDSEKEEKKSVEPKSKDKNGKRIKSDEAELANYEQENEELRMWLTAILDEEETVDPEILSTKYPIVDWESQILWNVDMEDKHVYKIIRANGNTKKKYPLIKEMLEKMLNWKQEAGAESTMTFKLIKFIKSQIEE